MTRKKNNKDPKKTQPHNTNVVKLPPRHDYDLKVLEGFLELVFHNILMDGEEILTWITKGIPAYPISEDDLFAKLPRTPLAKSLYFSTATATPDPADGRIYNRKALFKRLHVLVLDDIGTKIPLSALKPDFLPTYVIETSEGNFQYGYVFENPIDDLEQAEALIQLVYEAGITDKGGRMANKLVRLPDGVNGKVGEKQNFRVKLILSNGPLWTPAQILETLDLGVTWAEIEDDAYKVSQIRAHKGAKLTVWSPITPNLPTTNGIIDQALEWLYDVGMVKQETNEWVTIKCPWADQHTTGEDWASYSPLGWGGAAYQNSRGFHCFHEHCRSKHGRDMMDFISNAKGPNLPATEYAAHLTSSYAFDPVLNGVWEMCESGPPVFIPLEGFKNLHPSKVWITTPDGKFKQVAETSLFITSKARVTVNGIIYDPSSPAKLIKSKHGKLLMNTYTLPPWGDGDYDWDTVTKFIDFLKYLIPDGESYNFYIDWLAAKMQSMAFRGPAILMIAPRQGTGRTTLGNMIAALMGAENVEKVPFERLTKGSEGFNDWISKPMIITDETLALGSTDNFYKIYEKLKELIDTTPVEMRINPKFGKQRFQLIYSSFMLFSNHEGAMKIADDDRRIYVINNVALPAPPEYFTELYAWLKTDWEQSVWRWLRQRKVDVNKLLAPANMTYAKKSMIDANKQAIDVAVEAVLDAWPSALIASMHIKTILANYHHRLNITDHTRIASRINKIHKNLTLLLEDNRKHKINGTSVKLRSIPNKSQKILIFDGTNIDTEKEKFPNDKQMAAIRLAVGEALDEYDF